MDLIAYELVQSQQKQQQSAVVGAIAAPAAPSTTTTSASLHIHRTLNWQKIALVASAPEFPPFASEQPTAAAAAATGSNIHKNAHQQHQQIHHCVEWRPDGRFLAVAGTAAVSLYSLEGLLKASGTQDPHLSLSSSSSGGEDAAAAGKVHTCTLLPVAAGADPITSANKITSLSWVHVGCEHPSWPGTSSFNYDDSNDHCFQLFQNADRRLKYVLPPSEYHGSDGSGGNHHHHHEGHYYDDDAVLPTRQTPLSLLCVLTESGLSLFLHGRYAIAYNLPLAVSAANAAPTFVATADLTHLIATAAAAPDPTSSSPQFSTAAAATITILSVSALSRHRYDLQTVATQYCKVMQHLGAVRSSLPEIAASWKSSLKAVDLKLDGLQKLLENYGLVTIGTKSRSRDDGADEDDKTSTAKNDTKQSSSMRSLLVQYILSGHTRSAPNLSNAVDQFFTGVQMNDQLVQRMERSLSGAVANVESSVRRQLLAPATALVYEIDQLYGLAAAAASAPDGSETLLSAAVTLQFLQSAQQLHLSVETALTALVDARGRLRDFCAWLRCTGAQIKARGTAANSVQRENAKKRRVPATVGNKMLAYLQQQQPVATLLETGGGCGTTEAVLGLRFADLLRETSVPVTSLRSVSPASVLNVSTATGFTAKATPTVPHVLEETSALADKVFAYPRLFLAQSIRRTEIRLPGASSSSQNVLATAATTTRLGQGGIDPELVTFGEDRPEGFFSPKTLDSPSSTTITAPVTSDFRQWTVVAQTIDESTLQLHAFPLTWTNATNDDFDDYEIDEGLASELDWTVRLTLPSEYSIRDIAFYGDDGKSSLSSSFDSGAGQEGRQRLGLLVSRRRLNEGEAQPETPMDTVELWLVPYDDLEFTCLSLEKERTGDSTVFQCCSASNNSPGVAVNNFAVRPTPKANNDDQVDELDPTNLEDRILYARTREVFAAVDFAKEHDRPCRLVLSGSRGIGAVLANQQGGTVLEVLDLEEDEEEEEVEAMDAEDEEY